MFKLPEYAVSLIDTPQFQRLRDLKQLGVTYLVFPGAAHNRFEHSLGTAHLAWSVAGRLTLLQGKSLDLNKSDVAVATMAGLCHDLGHGPFSHVFDNELLPRLGITDFSHEEMSCRLFDDALEEAMSGNSRGARFLDELHAETGGKDFELVKDMISNGKGANNKRDKPGYDGRRYLFDIVANTTNSIDVDKFDYIVRDAYYTGVKVSFEYKPVTANMCIFDDQIAFRRNQVHNLYELFHARSSMHRRVYTHPKAKAMEYMIVDALSEAASHLKIRERIQGSADFMKLDDTILKQIELYEGSDAGMARARDIIGRLKRRDIYTCCGDVVVPKSVATNPDYKKIEPQDILNSCDHSILTPDDVIVHNLKIDFAMGSQNPLENVKLYDADYAEARTMPMCSMSTMYATEPIERRVRVFLKSRDPVKVRHLQECFDKWGAREYGEQHFATATPAKKSGFKGVLTGKRLREKDDGGDGVRRQLPYTKS